MKYDLVIIGGGPAGLSAAVQAKELGLSCILLDEQPAVGGMIYRNLALQHENNKKIFGPDYQAGMPLINSFNKSSIERVHNAVVWHIEESGKVFYSSNKRAYSVEGKKILLATGSQERAMPIPGWTLPGVMNAGAAQILLKKPGIAAEGAVFAGSGPLLYLIVYQYILAGIKVAAVLDTTASINYIKSIRHITGMVAGHQQVIKGIKLLYTIKKAKIPLYQGISSIKACSKNKDELDSVCFTTSKGRQEIATEHLFLHQGVIPQINLALASGCQHNWDAQQLCWLPEIDQWGQSNQAHLSIAGDGTSIGGAVAAALLGKISVLQIAVQQGKLTTVERDKKSVSLRKKLSKEILFRPFVDTLYRPTDKLRIPQYDDVIVCRCEEIRVSDIKDAIKKGCKTPNQLKSFSRCGMGPCQGRQCGNIVSELMAEITKKPVQEIGYYRLRSPIKPLNMNELRELHNEK